jgi:lipoate-protein ligase A
MDILDRFDVALIYSEEKRREYISNGSRMCLEKMIRHGYLVPDLGDLVLEGVVEDIPEGVSERVIEDIPEKVEQGATEIMEEDILIKEATEDIPEKVVEEAIEDIPEREEEKEEVEI